MVDYCYDIEDSRPKTQDPIPQTATEAGKIEQKQTDVTDAVCPQCFKPLPGPRMFGEPDRYGRELRKYLGFCPSCNLGCEVIQFRREGRWVIHRYQLYPYAGAIWQGTGHWVTLNVLPEPAPVVIGPGGEFDKQIYPVASPGVELLKKFRQALEALCQTIKCLMRGPGL